MRRRYLDRELNHTRIPYLENCCAIAANWREILLERTFVKHRSHAQIVPLSRCALVPHWLPLPSMESGLYLKEGLPTLRHLVLDPYHNRLVGLTSALPGSAVRFCFLFALPIEPHWCPRAICARGPAPWFTSHAVPHSMGRCDAPDPNPCMQAGRGPAS